MRNCIRLQLNKGKWFATLRAIFNQSCCFSCLSYFLLEKIVGKKLRTQAKLGKNRHLLLPNKYATEF